MNNQVYWNIDKTCCFTGHRNRDLPFSGDRRKQGMKCLVSSLQMYIEKAVNDGYDTFISGMAEGVDLICAEIVYNLITRKGMDLKLICAVPYKNQGVKELSNPIDQYVYSMISRDCNNIVYISDKKSRDCYQKRNRFMVENSRRVIGVIKDENAKSGTFQTINMAKRAGLELNIIYLDKNPVFYLSDDSEIFIQNSGAI
ncbi:MAG: DUF1273 domain-containing protein [Ruminococcus sp.]|nr:DUF1273 domain-containing protein [Ruminococcus sp.]